MAKNPAQYGLDELTLEKPLPYDTVKINYPVDLRLVAQCVDVSAAEVQDLNPSLLRLTTPKDQSFELHLPAGTKDLYLSSVGAIPSDMRLWWRYHKVAAGDTLASVAHTYRTTPRAIAQANNLQATEDLQTESKLIIPIAPGKHATTEDGASYARRPTRYSIRKGDTVQTVADNFGVPPTMVRRWNHLKGDSLHGRHVLYVHLPVTPSVGETHTSVASKSKSKSTLRAGSPASAQRHKVRPGETLTSIASTHHTTVAALKRDNGNLATLRPGMILVIRDIQ
jgi:membrane-bound lytic murein transglycosylase D